MANPKGAYKINGIPMLGSHMTTGNVFFLDSNTGSDSYNGQSIRTPKATLNGVMDVCTANKGDIVYVMPGHAENVSAATTQIIDVAGLRIIGVGVGDTRPTFTYTATGGSFEIDAADTYIENIKFLTSVSAVVVGVNVDADNVTIHNCEFNYDASGDDFIIMIDIDAVDYAEITNNRFIAQDAAGAANAIRLDDALHVQIKNNVFSGDFSKTVILSDTDCAVSTDLVIANNLMRNSDTAVGSCIEFDIANTGMLSYNNYFTSGASNATAVDPGSCMSVECYAVCDIDKSGIIIPAATST